jgi:hypothetical protein
MGPDRTLGSALHWGAHLRLVVCLAVTSLACAPAIRITTDESVDFAAYRTWGWRVGQPIEAASEPEQVALARALAAHVAREMAARGFTYAASAPDLEVTPELTIRRRHVTVHTAKADQFLPSLHASPSYQIEGMSVEETRVYDVADLAISVRDRSSGALVWHGRLRGQFQGSFARHVSENIAALMRPFPETSPMTDETIGTAIAQARSGTDAAAR